MDCAPMDAQNGVQVEDKNCINENGVCVDPAVSDTDKQNVANGDNGSLSKVAVSNGADSDCLKGSKIKSRGPKGYQIDVDSKVSKPSKESASIADTNLKTKMVIREQLEGKVTASSLRKPNLSQSFSFSSKTSHGSLMKKSLDASALKSNSKQSQSNGKMSDSPSSEASVTSDSVTNHSKGHVLGEVTSKETNPKKNTATSKRTSPVSVPSAKHSLTEKSGEKGANGNGVASDFSQDDQCSPPAVKEALPADSDEPKLENQDLNNFATRKSVTFGFAFRLDERAEKRKEFNMKLEEKISAIEAEKNNLQAKSKESQEAEIKQLRKSLNFKATPMPSFYKEPLPKVELKKIPTTRPVSPKLGRNKSSAGATNNTSELGASCVSPRVSTLSKKVHSSGEKSVADSAQKAVKKSQPKLQPRESVGPRSEEKIVKSKPKKKLVETEIEMERAEEKEEAPRVAQNSGEDSEPVNQVSEIDISQGNGVIPSTPQAKSMPGEIMVGG